MSVRLFQNEKEKSSRLGLTPTLSLMEASASRSLSTIAMIPVGKVRPFASDPHPRYAIAID